MQQNALNAELHSKWLLSVGEGTVPTIHGNIIELPEEIMCDTPDQVMNFIYDNFEEMASVIQEVFELNPHSVHTLNKHKEGIYAVALDNLNIVYTMN